MSNGLQKKLDFSCFIQGDGWGNYFCNINNFFFED